MAGLGATQPQVAILVQKTTEMKSELVSSEYLRTIVARVGAKANLIR